MPFVCLFGLFIVCAGETVALFVDVRVVSDPASALKTPCKEPHDSAVSAPLSPIIASTAAAAALRRRWKKFCESARVDIRVVEENGAPTKPKAPRMTLFHQDAQLELVQETRRDVPAGDANDSHALLVFRSEVLLKVRSEYWNRPLKLLVRITPPVSVASGESAAFGHDRPSSSASLAQLDPFAATSFFTEQLQNDHVLRLVREETMAAEPLTRSVERQICVVKPLQLKMETRYLSKERVCIIAKASNTHAQLELKILDLHLHLNESYSTTSTSEVNSSRTPPKELSTQQLKSTTTRRPQRQFRIVNDAQERFPIRIQGAEQFNFLFVLEAIETKGSIDEEADGDGGENGGDDDNASESDKSRAGDVQDERAASMSKRRAPTRTAMKRHSSSGSFTSAIKSAASSATKSAKRLAGGQTQQTLLTLSWEACPSPSPVAETSSRSETRRLSAPITEYHTIIWSPQSVAIEVRQEHNALVTASPSLPVSAFTELIALNGTSAGDVSVAHLSKQSPLSMSLAPSSSQQNIRVGEVFTLCVVITNRSQHNNFDLTLLSPFTQQHPAAAVNGHENQLAQHRQDVSRGPGWLSFETTHRLGYVPCTCDLVVDHLQLTPLLLFLSVLCRKYSVVPPGLTVRKSVRVVFLRSGKRDLHRFALFDHVSRTCFVPPAAVFPSTSSSSAAWEVFIKS